MIRFDLPEEIIQHIQYFLGGKDAAQTCLLSKSWYHAWSTSPVLAFDIKLQRDKSRYYYYREDIADKDEFAAIRKSMLKSMERYYKSNINLQKLEIRIFKYENFYRYDDNYDRLVDELIRGASELGVNELHLDCEALSHIPARVFSMTSLTKLYILGKLPPMSDNGVCFSKLVSLHLKRVYATNNNVIQDILLQCPLIEKLDLEDINNMYKDINNMYNGISINVSELHNLVYLRVYDQYGLYGRMVKLSFDSITQGGLVNNVPQFHKLRVVCLEGVNIKGSFFTNFSSRFPCIEDLSLDCWRTDEVGIQISSKTLKYLILLSVPDNVENAEFDVPNIRKFGFTSSHIPALSFSNVSREWESKIELSPRLQIIESCWFEKLREFLNELSLSRISLSINILKLQLIWVKDLPCSSLLPVVEIFKVNHSTSRPVTHDLMCALFRCCRPTCISIGDLDPDSYRCAKILHELFVVNQKIVNYAECCFSEMQSLLMYDLEEIHVEILKENECHWQSTPLSKFVRDVNPFMSYDDDNSDDSTGPYSTGEMRFQFKWGAFRCVKSHEDNIPRNKESVKRVERTEKRQKNW